MAATAQALRSISRIAVRLGNFLHLHECRLRPFAYALADERDRLRRPRAFAIDRQPHGHARAVAEPARDIHLAAVQPHQAFDDRQPEPGAVMAAVVGGARLKEGFAEPRQIVLADADAGVLDRERDLGTFAGRADRRPGRRAA